MTSTRHRRPVALASDWSVSRCGCRTAHPVFRFRPQKASVDRAAALGPVPEAPGEPKWPGHSPGVPFVTTQRTRTGIKSVSTFRTIQSTAPGSYQAARTGRRAASGTASGRRGRAL